MIASVNINGIYYDIQKSYLDMHKLIELNKLHDIDSYNGKKVSIMKGLLIDDTDICIFNDTTYQYLIDGSSVNVNLLYDEDNEKWSLSIDSTTYDIYNVSNRSYVNENCKINVVNLIIVHSGSYETIESIFIYDNTDGTSEVLYSYLKVGDSVGIADNLEMFITDMLKSGTTYKPNITIVDTDTSQIIYSGYTSLPNTIELEAYELDVILYNNVIEYYDTPDGYAPIGTPLSYKVAYIVVNTAEQDEEDLETTLTGSTISTFNYTVNNLNINTINIEYNIESNQTLKFTSTDIIQIKSIVIIDNMEWMILSSSVTETNLIEYTATLEHLFDKTTDYAYVDTTNTDTTIAKSTLRTKTNNTFPSKVEEPILNFENISSIVSQSVKDIINNVETVKVDDLAFDIIDTSNSTYSIDKYSNLDTFNLDSFDISSINVAKQITKNKIYAKNKFKQSIFPFDLKYNFESDDNISKDLGYMIIASDGPETATKPMSRFTYMYKPTLIYTDHVTNILGLSEEDTIKVVDGKLTKVSPNKSIENYNKVHPFNICRFSSAKPVIPNIAEPYLDSIVPNLISWSECMVTLAPFYIDGSYKLIPTTNQYTTYIDPATLRDSGCMDETYWTRSIVSYAEVNESSNTDYQVLNGLYLTDDNGESATLLENDLKPSTLIKLDSDNYQMIENTSVKDLYIADKSKPPFCCNLVDGKFSGLFYLIKNINKKKIEMAQQGLSFNTNISKLAVVIDMNVLTNNMSTVEDSATNLYNMIKIYQKVNGNFQQVTMGIPSNLSTDGVVDILTDASTIVNDTNLISIALEKLEYVDVEDTEGFMGETPYKKLSNTIIEQIIIIPPRDYRCELHAVLKLFTNYTYFTTYNFGSKPHIAIPYTTLKSDFDILDDDNYLISNIETYDKLRKTIKPVTNKSITITKTIEHSTTDNSDNEIMKQFGISTFPCKVSYCGKTYFANSCSMSKSGKQLTCSLELDDRNIYYDDIGNEEVSDINCEISDFTYRRRLMSFIHPSDSIYLPNEAVDTYLKDKIKTMINNTTSYYGDVQYTDVNITTESTFKYPDSLNCTIDGGYKFIDNKGYIVIADLSGYELKSGTPIISDKIPTNIQASKKYYVGLSFQTYTNAVSTDTTSSSVTVELSDSTCEFVYPDESGSSITLDLRTDCLSSITFSIEAFERFNSSDCMINPPTIANYTDYMNDTNNTPEEISVAETEFNKLRNTLTSGENMKTVTVTATLPNGQTTYKINRFDIRVDNDLFKVIASKDAHVWISRANTNPASSNEFSDTYSERLKFDDEERDKIEKEYFITATTNDKAAGESDNDYSSNATDVTFTFSEDAENEDIGRFLLAIPQQMYGKDFILNSSDPDAPTTFKKFLYVSTSKLCQLHVGYNPNGQIDLSQISSVTDSQLEDIGETYNLYPGQCRIIPLCVDNGNNNFDFNIGSIWLSNIQQGTTITVYGLQYYADGGFDQIIEIESVQNANGLYINSKYMQDGYGTW